MQCTIVRVHTSTNEALIWWMGTQNSWKDCAFLPHLRPLSRFHLASVHLAGWTVPKCATWEIHKCTIHCRRQKVPYKQKVATWKSECVWWMAAIIKIPFHSYICDLHFSWENKIVFQWIENGENSFIWFFVAIHQTPIPYVLDKFISIFALISFDNRIPSQWFYTIIHLKFFDFLKLVCHDFTDVCVWCYTDMTIDSSLPFQPLKHSGANLTLYIKRSLTNLPRGLKIHKCMPWNVNYLRRPF